jgi:hypothetical protein
MIRYVNCAVDFDQNSNIYRPFDELDKYIKKIQYVTHLYLFDWDDTLFPRTFLYNGDYFPNKNKIDVPDNIYHKIKKLENIILLLFTKILSFGEIVIITNSDQEWINITCKKFMPSLYVFIKNKILYISAKNIFSKQYPNDPILWKICLMKYIIKKYYNENKNVISIGDALTDSIAIRSVYKHLKLNSDNAKIIKFINYPSIDQLLLQLSTLYTNIKLNSIT